MNRRASIEIIDSLLEIVVSNAGLDLVYSMESREDGKRPHITVEFTGSDVPLLVARNGELLLAIEHIATKALGLEPEDHDRIRFEAGGFKANRERNLKDGANAAIAQVMRTGVAYEFPPMSSHERRLLHLALADCGFRSASVGDGPLRHLVLYP